MHSTCVCRQQLLVALVASFAAVCRGQAIDVAALPGLGGKHGRWYVWLIVSIAGATILYVLFFVVRGFLVARRRKAAFSAEGIAESDTVYGKKHEAILQKLLPRYKVPQGTKDANLSPMLTQLQSTGLSVYKVPPGKEEP